jgi:hypothetical protein
MLFCRGFGQNVHLNDVIVILLGGLKCDVIVSRNLHCGIAGMAWCTEGHKDVMS